MHHTKKTPTTIPRSVAIQSVRKMRLEAQKRELHKMTPEEIAREVKTYRKTRIMKQN